MNTTIIVAIIGTVGAVAAAAVAALIQTGQLPAYLKALSDYNRRAVEREKERLAARPPLFVQYVLMVLFVAFVSYLLFFIGSMIALACCAAPTALAGDPVVLTGGAIGGIIGLLRRWRWPSGPTDRLAGRRRDRTERIPGRFACRSEERTPHPSVFGGRPVPARERGSEKPQ